MKTRKPLILVVDDEALLRMLAAEYFEDSGYEVVEAKDGNEAVEILKARPDIQGIFTDVQMPGRPDGFGVARQARLTHPTCAVVVVSARQWPEEGSLEPGMRFITKPYDGSVVVKMFDEMIVDA
jgi:CheY-like chemotaxis protein